MAVLHEHLFSLAAITGCEPGNRATPPGSPQENSTENCSITDRSPGAREQEPENNRSATTSPHNGTITRHTSPFKRTPVIRISAKTRGKSPGGLTKRWSMGKGAFKFLTQSAALSVFNNNNDINSNKNTSNSSSGKKQTKTASPEGSTKVMSSTPKVTPVMTKPGAVHRKRFARFGFKRSFSLFGESPLPNTYSLEKSKQYKRHASVQEALSPICHQKCHRRCLQVWERRKFHCLPQRRCLSRYQQDTCTVILV